MSLLAWVGIGESSALAVGAPAPAVRSRDENAQPIDFAEAYRAGRTLVYFYPKAQTPGCTKQACALRDSFSSLEARGVRVLGVSGDQPEAQRKFRERHALPFTLVADTDGSVARAFGVPTFLGIPKRQSFLIEEGKVVWRDLSASPKSHVADVHRALDALG